jgi:nicotinate-nucleotide--dimethylbenzimidazole phosphoribosyltransferase
MVLNMVHGGAAVSVMCRKAGFGYTVVDMGVNYDFEEIPGLMRKKIKKGTNNSTEQPAMSRQECEQAVGAGYDIAMECTADLVGVGEMGIGNTSSASALYSLLFGKPASETTGTGAGSTGDLLQRKMNAVQKAVDLHQKEWDRTPFDALRRVGGFEIAGMSGMIIGCAAKRIPVAVDGFTASAAALVAMRMNQAIRDYLFFSHESSEKFHRDFFRHEGIRPILTLDMRLGEGTGAVLAMQLIVQALECYHAMATFSSAGVSEKIG